MGKAPPDPDAPAKQQQMKLYEEALTHFQQQKFHRASRRSSVYQGPEQGTGRPCSGSFADLRATDLAPSCAPAKSAEDHYTQGVALMNLGRWDEAREHLDRARKAAPKADHIVYAMAALDCLTGEADSAMQNLKIAIQLRPENRYHARNDEV